MPIDFKFLKQNFLFLRRSYAEHHFGESNIIGYQTGKKRLLESLKFEVQNSGVA